MKASNNGEGGLIVNIGSMSGNELIDNELYSIRTLNLHSSH